MSFRKIIKFGESSHVISLPKEWLERNSLKKGDLVEIDQTDDEVTIRSHKKESKREPKDIIIDIDKNHYLKDQIISAYINNYDTINIVGTNIEKYLDEIRITTSYLVALEIIQQTNKKVTLKDFLNVKDINLFEIIRRMDRIIESIFENVKDHINGNDKFEQIKNKEGDVNRLNYLASKIIRKATDPSIRRQLDLKFEDLIYLLDLTITLEKISDHLKRIPKFMNPPVEKEIKDLFERIHQHYKKTLQAHFKNDKLAALEILNSRNQLIIDCDDCFTRIDIKNALILEKMKNIIRNTSGITKSIANRP